MCRYNMSNTYIYVLLTSPSLRYFFVVFLREKNVHPTYIHIYICVYNNIGNGPEDLDHIVLAVGYGTLDNKSGNKFFMIKNSWSTHWGMDGYILMSRTNNNCGIATDASYADVV